jgi:ferric-dicitrate binding protein FerR (iron transport regulator)
MMRRRLRSAVAREAIDWFVLNRGGEIEEGQQRAFLRWLKASPLCVEEYLRISVLSQDLQEAMSSAKFDVDAWGNERANPAARFGH